MEGSGPDLTERQATSWVALRSGQLPKQPVLSTLRRDLLRGSEFRQEPTLGPSLPPQLRRLFETRSRSALPRLREFSPRLPCANAPAPRLQLPERFHLGHAALREGHPVPLVLAAFLEPRQRSHGRRQFCPRLAPSPEV